MALRNIRGHSGMGTMEAGSDAFEPPSLSNCQSDEHDNVGLEQLSRHELQQKAKALGIRANQKSSELIAAIRERVRSQTVCEKQMLRERNQAVQATSPPYSTVRRSENVNPMTPKTPALSNVRRAVAQMSEDDSVNKNDLADEAPPPFLTAVAFRSPNGSSPRITIDIQNKSVSPKNTSMISIPPSSRVRIAENGISFSPSAVSGLNPVNRGSFPLATSRATGVSRQVVPCATNASLLARVNGRMSPPKELSQPDQQEHFHVSTASQKSFTSPTPERRLIHPRSVPKHPEALTGVRRAFTTVPASQSTPPTSVASKSILSVSIARTPGGGGGHSNENSKERINPIAKVPPVSALKQAMTVERTRRREMRRMLDALGWEKVESRSKPGQFYFYHRETGKTSWDPPISPQEVSFVF